jgi:hypothetical protein
MVDFNRPNIIARAKRLILEALTDKWEDMKLKDMLTLAVAEQQKRIEALEANLAPIQSVVMLSEHGIYEKHPMLIGVFDHSEDGQSIKYIFASEWHSEWCANIEEAIHEYIMDNKGSHHVYFIDRSGKTYDAVPCDYKKRQIKINGEYYEHN